MQRITANLTLNLVLTYATYIRCLTVSAENENLGGACHYQNSILDWEHEKKRSDNFLIKNMNNLGTGCIRKIKYFDD